MPRPELATDNRTFAGEASGRRVKIRQYGIRWPGLVQAMFLQSIALAADFVGQVVGVLDGDTIDIIAPAKT